VSVLAFKIFLGGIMKSNEKDFPGWDWLKISVTVGIVGFFVGGVKFLIKDFKKHKKTERLVRSGQC
jgi:ABC-type uncharacterized transport system permease subunit